MKTILEDGFTQVKSQGYCVCSIEQNREPRTFIVLNQFDLIEIIKLLNWGEFIKEKI